MTAALERSLIAADGTALFVRDWLVPEGQPVRGGVVLMHGLGEHCGRYAHVADFFNQLGWSVRAYDHRGHGRSQGARGDVPATDTLLDDAEQVIRDFSHANASHWSAPPLLFGHSMGGLFAARFAGSRRMPLRGLILSSPALALSLTATQRLLLKLMTVVAPGFAVSNGLKADYLTHDRAVVDAYRCDPLGQGKVSARLLHAMFDAIDRTHAGTAALTCPVLMLVAGDDRLVDAQGSARLFAKLDPARATLHRYPALYHEIFNETAAERQRVFDDLRAWLAMPGR